jgi:hypothetical protein
MKLKPIYILIQYFCVLLGMFSLVSCQKASELDIPSYISIDSISLTVTGEQGSASNKIVDAWVYTDNDLEGAFELPALFPVLKSGASVLTILPGVKLNGMAETRAAYPFFNPIIIPATLTHEKETKLKNISTTYNPKTVFALIEDFEDPNIAIDTTSRSGVKLTRIGDPSLSSLYPGEGNSFAGKISIQDDSTLFECVSHDAFVFPKYSSDMQSSVFLELNYKNNCAFTVGLIIYGAQTVQRSVVIVNPSTTWNKIYVNFTPTVLANTDASKFRIFISAQKAEDGPDAEILIDNIKLLHF